VTNEDVPAWEVFGTVGGLPGALPDNLDKMRGLERDPVPEGALRTSHARKWLVKTSDIPADTHTSLDRMPHWRAGPRGPPSLLSKECLPTYPTMEIAMTVEQRPTLTLPVCEIALSKAVEIFCPKRRPRSSASQGRSCVSSGETGD
jgi:hypothetical protein